MRLKARLDEGFGYGVQNVTVVEFFYERFIDSDGKEHMGPEKARYYDKSGKFGTCYPYHLTVIDDG